MTPATGNKYISQGFSVRILVTSETPFEKRVPTTPQRRPNKIYVKNDLIVVLITSLFKSAPP